MVNIGNKLKLLRAERNLTQKQVANRVGVAVSAMSAYESGLRYPSYNILIKLASIYHVSCDYLIGYTDTRCIDLAGLDEDDIALVTHTVDVLRSKHPSKEQA